MEATASVTKVDLSYAQKHYRFQLSKKRINSRVCFIPEKQPRKDGYVRFSVPPGKAKEAFGPSAEEKESTFYLHHLAWYVAGKQMPLPRKEHLSHLCSDSRCFNVAHLVVESPIVNNSRKNCGFVVTCPCPCNHEFLPCDHKPQCIPRKRPQAQSS